MSDLVIIIIIVIIFLTFSKRHNYNDRRVVEHDRVGRSVAIMPTKYNYYRHRRRRSRASTVLTAISLVNGKALGIVIFDPHKIDIP